MVGFGEGPLFEASVRRLKELSPVRTSAAGIACGYFGAYKIRSRVVQMVGSGVGHKFEVNVRRLNRSAIGAEADTGEMQRTEHRSICSFHRPD